MKHINLLIITIFTMMILVGCGSSGSESKTPSQTAIEVKTELPGNQYYVVKDNINTKQHFIISIDTNATSWDIEVADSNFTATADPVSDTISIDDSSITDSNGKIILVNNTDDYINFKTQSSNLAKLKFFTSKDEAIEYTNISLSDTLKNNSYYAVQDYAGKRYLYFMEFDTNATSWDLLTYSSNFEENSITGTYSNIDITTTDSYLVDGSIVYWFNSAEEKYLSLVASDESNKTILMQLYPSKDDALNKYNSYDLRDELRSDKFYAVSNTRGIISTLTLEFNELLSSYDISIYSDNFTTETQSGSSPVVVQEDRFTDSGDTLVLSDTTQLYIELEALNSTQVLRLYNTEEEAKSYYTKITAQEE